MDASKRGTLLNKLADLIERDRVILAVSVHVPSKCSCTLTAIMINVVYFIAFVSLCLFVLLLNVPANSYGQVGTSSLLFLDMPTNMVPSGRCLHFS